MKKQIIGLLAAIFSALLLIGGAGCTANSEETAMKNKEKISVLIIGNSYSDDTIDLAYEVAKSAGINKIEIADLYYGGCSIDQHVSFANGDLAKYIFRFFDETGSLNVPTSIASGVELSTMKYGIQFKKWDYIVLQQQSINSGIPSSYAKLDALIDYVKKTVLTPNIKLAFHMTWAGREGTNTAPYGGQAKMHEAIVSAVKEKIQPNDAFVKIIPNGTAIQNARTSLIGDALTRDSVSHLTLDLGRYIAAMTFVQTISGVDVSNISYAPNRLSSFQIAIAKESVSNAIANPYEITKSEYDAFPSIIKGMEKRDLTFRRGYYNSMLVPTFYADDNIAKAYYATEQFTQKELPVGAIIYIENGYQYRPEGWKNGEKSNARPQTVKTQIIEITEEWWDTYTERAFNISAANNAPLTKTNAELNEIFRIYLPTNYNDPL